ncbi:MAG TPA: M3 family metallopeptidase, partial [Chthoniobacterales bacterium]|nr:M3 family metallopeptidase [Chthoniobacterales bacterium]
MTASSANPLLTESTLPFNLPPFDKIKDEHFQPALEQGMADEIKEVEKIASQTEKPTFENTIVALEKSGQLLARARRIFSNFAACNTNPTIQKLEKEFAPKFAAHADAIHLSSALFARVETLYNARESSNLDPESKWLLERYYKDFVRAGAKLNEEQKTRLKAINGELAKLTTDFEQNVLKEKNASSVVVEKKEDLTGMADNEIAAAAKAAKDDGKEGKFEIRMLNTTGQPALASLQNRALRDKIMATSLARNSHGGEFDNKEVVSRIAKLRAERATLLGYPNHAAYQLEDQTAKDVPTVNKLLSDLAPAAVANAKKEGADMQQIIDKENGGFQLAAGDWDFYSEKVRKARYAFDESQLKPYYELNHVIVDG